MQHRGAWREALCPAIVRAQAKTCARVRRMSYSSCHLGLNFLHPCAVPFILVASAAISNTFQTYLACGTCMCPFVSSSSLNNSTTALTVHEPCLPVFVVSSCMKYHSDSNRLRELTIPQVPLPLVARKMVDMRFLAQDLPLLSSSSSRIHSLCASHRDFEQIFLLTNNFYPSSTDGMVCQYCAFTVKSDRHFFRESQGYLAPRR